MSKAKSALTAPRLEKLTLPELREVLRTLNPRCAVMLHGPPGIGKTSMVMADESLQPVEQIGLATRQPEDIGGCPSLNHTDRTTEFYPCGWFVKYCVTPTNKNPIGTIFFDEFDKGSEEKQTTVMRILSERTIENMKLGPWVRVIVAANRKEDAAGAFHEMPKVIRNRLIHFEIVPNFTGWLKEFAAPQLIHPMVISYIQRNGDDFCNYEPSNSDFGFPTPRSWEQVSDLLYAGESAHPHSPAGRLGSGAKKQSLNDSLVAAGIIGAIGRGTQVKFMDFAKYVHKCPPIPELAAGRAEFPSTDQPDMWVALVSRCISFAEETLRTGEKDTSNLKTVAKVLALMPDDADIHRLLLATQLNTRPTTASIWIDCLGEAGARKMSRVLSKLSR